MNIFLQFFTKLYFLYIEHITTIHVKSLINQYNKSLNSNTDIVKYDIINETIKSDIFGRKYMLLVGYIKFKNIYYNKFKIIITLENNQKIYFYLETYKGNNKISELRKEIRKNLFFMIKHCKNIISHEKKEYISFKNERSYKKEHNSKKDHGNEVYKKNNHKNIFPNNENKRHIIANIISNNNKLKNIYKKIEDYYYYAKICRNILIISSLIFVFSSAVYLYVLFKLKI
ncbi:hypothetical protein SLOPH_1127 [Spraguea lophii 42_110]|uniref:Uncharacterized protein n=1 Tax=Spraguea lophii (strain 42_110) TaxID=1358809 RepID=S7W9T5_SPRLO|nr:hypothetical protein SLOPH_1127 [Spraguea lophii 42_110]